MKFRNLFFSLTAIFLCSASISATQLNHTWVSGSGIDTNPCTFAAPCATFQAALTNTSAYGTITAKDAGDFGPVSIAQPLTLDGANMGSISFASGNAINITNPGNVVIQNLTLNGLGSGHVGIEINPNSNGSTVVENCKIMNFTINGIDFEGTGQLTVDNSQIVSFNESNLEITPSNTVNGISANGINTQFLVVKNTLIDGSDYVNNNVGILTWSGSIPVHASLQNVTITHTFSGALAISNANVEVTGSTLTYSSLAVNAGASSTISVTNSMITNNTTGFCSGVGSKIRLDNNDIYDNTTAIANCGGIVKTSGTNKTSGTIAIPASDVSESVTF